MSDGGKGSAPRPFSVPHSDFAANFDKIFGASKNDYASDTSIERVYMDTENEHDEDDEDEICSWCSGSGEGMHDGASCRKCHGTGIEPVEREDEP